MVYTEVKRKNNRKYYYRVKSVRVGDKIKKERKYLGVNLNKKELKSAEERANKKLLLLSSLLTYKELKFLKSIKKSYLKESKKTFENRYESFCALFTYNSTAIEGNTISLQETAQLLFENTVPRSRSLREVNETLNHKKAFDYMLNYKGDITKSFIFKLHRLIIKDTLKSELIPQIGKYRDLMVYIKGVDWIPPKPSEVSKDMKSLLSWYSKNKKKLHPLIVAGYFHIGFETIHPFIDGNGRVGRLLMNFILHKNNFPMINLPNSLKYRYYTSLEEAQIRGNLRAFILFLINLLKSLKLRY